MRASAESQLLTQQHTLQIFRVDYIFHCFHSALNELIVSY